MKRLALLLVGILVGTGLAGCGRGDDSPHLVAYFHDVGDLVNGATVQLNDVEIGSVTDIGLVMQNGEMLARVGMDLENSARVPATNLSALIRQTSLLGEQFVDLVPRASGGPFVDASGMTIPLDRTDRRVSVETFLGDLSSFIGGGGLEDLNRFTHAQALILENRGERFGQVIGDLEKFTGVLAQRRFDVENAIDDLAGASSTLVHNKDTLDSFLDSLDEANQLLAGQGNRLRGLFVALQRFGRVNSRFLAQHEGAIDRQFRALRPIFSGLASAQGELRTDVKQLNTFLGLFPKSLGGGPGGKGAGDYVQADAVLCESLGRCHTKGEKGNVPGEGS